MSKYPGSERQFVGYLYGIPVYGALNTSQLSIPPDAEPLMPYGKAMAASMSFDRPTLADRMAADPTQDWT